MVKLGTNSEEIQEMLRTLYGNKALKKTTVFKWIKRFREVREDFKDEARLGQPSTSCIEDNIERVRSFVLSDCGFTVRMIVDQLNLEKSSIHTILRKFCVAAMDGCCIMTTRLHIRQ